MNKLHTIGFFILLCSAFAKAQLVQTSQADSLMLKSIYDYSLTESKSYEWLDYLSNNIGGRLSGSIQAQRAVEYTEKEIAKFASRTELQSVMVPKWTRGTPEFAYIQLNDFSTINVNVCALGGSIPTREAGIKAGVVEVTSLEQLAQIGRKEIEGKIVFYNRPMDPTKIQTFEAYGGCVDQRYSGAEEAGKYGAVGVIVRSMNLRLDDYPHTGSMSYGDLDVENYIPAAAISTNDAEKLHTYLSLDKNLQFFLKQDCTVWGDVESYNVIGEIKGTKYPNEVIIVGGHLDSWDLGDGSHDDGAGVVQSMQVLETLKKLDYQPLRTIRVVLFMNEENGLKGAREYAKQAKAKSENHIFALESDAGGFSPRGFSFDATEDQMKVVHSWKKLFKPYLIHYFEKGGSGADVGPLKDSGTVLAGLRPDSQRYFDFHHAANDTFDAVNKRELELGAATMTSLIYLFDQYGVVDNSMD
ncbi:PA domain-containing protein [Nonlabens xylanidelens]|uniref:Carboxypeptidase Q n=1 Tax=Nonlabens xylanidelens TaxID=191564 RepID=A0A2S6IDV4_9FLAO|nr:M20/M25/M40 family metallo-hydrolase [Nonlabens xylanidelens]PPK92398.1 PA domain-containing protein [Nonlabens xylanidelens]PQJ19733.1 peptidase M28 family protein [Nonlabens xylanidelens]